MMKTKFVYVLTSDDTDYYYEMALLSIHSLLRYHPKATVFLVMDEDTFNRLKERHSSILNKTTPVAVFIPKEYTKMQRSRYLKTRLPHFVNGNFLYLDTDTIICNSLKEIDQMGQMDINLGLVMDGNGASSIRGSFTRKYHIALTQNAGFSQMEEEPFYNGGVIYAKDNPITHLYFDTWHDSWKQSLLKGLSQDQPALYQTNKILNHPEKELPGVWNCQVYYTQALSYIPKAKVLHIYATTTNVFILFYSRMLKMVKHNGRITAPVALYLRMALPLAFIWLLLKKTLLTESSFKRFLLRIYYLFRVD